MLSPQSRFAFSDYFALYDIIVPADNLLRRILYQTDESIKEVLPSRNEDDILEQELAYTYSLVDIIKENEPLVCIPKIKEKLKLLKETLEDIADHYALSQDTDVRIGHKSKDNSFFSWFS